MDSICKHAKSDTLPDLGRVFDCALKMQSEQRLVEISVELEKRGLIMQISTLCNVAHTAVPWSAASICPWFEARYK
jgi:hypothetical protein